MKKSISILVCAIMLFSCLCPLVSAKENTTVSTTKIRVKNVTANPGNTVYVPVVASQNSGIKDYVFTLVYDESVLKYEGYLSGVLNDYNIYDNNSKGKITLVSLNGENKSVDGDLVTYKFSVKKKASEGKYKLTLSKTSFNDEKGNSVKYKVLNGEIKISRACKSDHLYSDWKTVTPVKCTSDGVKVKTCRKCGCIKTEIIPATGHNLGSEFTLDVVAENGKPGMLSRHCNKCGAKTNIIIYTEDKDAALNINNVAKKFDDTSISNLVYFLNGSRTYPDIYDENFDISGLVESQSSMVSEDGSINISASIDHILRKFFGNDKQSGLFGALKRAAIAGEIPIKLIKRLIGIILY